MNHEEQKEYEEKMGSPEMEHLQYLSENPIENNQESESQRNIRLGGSVEANREGWEEEFNKVYKATMQNEYTDEYKMENIKSLISQLLLEERKLAVEEYIKSLQD